MLLNSDKYASVGKDSERLLKVGAKIISIISTNKDETDDKILPILHNCIEQCFLYGKKKGTKVEVAIKNFISDLKKIILSKSDALIFSYTCSKVVCLTNVALNAVPSDDKEFTEEIGRTILKTQGIEGLKILINTWDDLGLKGCLEAERTQVINLYKLLKRELSIIEEIDEDGMDLTLTACIQEVERRLGQKRKGRGGRSLEDAASLILEHFNFSACTAPAHFQADIEVDKWIMTERKFYIGISCKRTLRERWKQVSSADMPNMGRYKIIQFFHLITYSKDLSDDKLALLGGYGHIFYLPDDDPTLDQHNKHAQLSKYVRPMSEFVTDLKKLIINN